MRAMSLPARLRASVPAYFAVLRSAASLRRKRISSVVKSISFRKERLRRFRAMGVPLGSERGVALDGAGHAVGAAAAAAELVALDGEDLDAGLAQRRVGTGVALVADDNAGF